MLSSLLADRTPQVRVTGRILSGAAHLSGHLGGLWPRHLNGNSRAKKQLAAPMV